MKIFTITNGQVIDRAKVETFTLKGAGVSIPAVIIGEEGRGRELGVLPVHLTKESYAKWQENRYVDIYFGEVSKTKAGRPKLIEKKESRSLDKAIVVMRTKIGYRGSNKHTGDLLKNEYFVLNETFDDKTAAEKAAEEHIRRKYGVNVNRINLELMIDNYIDKKLTFAPFPGEILVTGYIAQGDAGRMGSGSQHIAVMPANTVFRTAYTGRLYGAPKAHYYIYRDGEILAATKEERELTNMF